MKKIICSAAAISAFVIGCSDETTIENVSQMSVVESFDEIPDCGTGNIGEMIFVSDSASAYFCDEEGWRIFSKLDEEKDAESSSAKDDAKSSESKDEEQSSSAVASSSSGDEEAKSSESKEEAKSSESKDDAKSSESKAEEKSSSSVTSSSSTKEEVKSSESKVEEKSSSSVASSSSVKEEIASSSSEEVKPVENKCGDVVYDPATEICDKRDNTIYGTFQIYGTRAMNRNLNYKTAGSICGGAYSTHENGKVVDSWEWADETDRFNAGDCKKYGRLYPYSQFTTTTAIAGVCPEGTHLPTWSEALRLALAGNFRIDYYMDGNNWPDVKEHEFMEDVYGFNALPAGYYFKGEAETHHFNGKVEGAYAAGNGTGFWVMNGSQVNGYFWRKSYGYDYVLKIDEPKNYGFSVRCVVD